MKAYVVTADDCSYDEYDSCVVVADSPERALEIAKEQLFLDYQNLKVEEIDLSKEEVIVASYNAG